MVERRQNNFAMTLRTFQLCINVISLCTPWSSDVAATLKRRWERFYIFQYYPTWHTMDERNLWNRVNVETFSTSLQGSFWRSLTLVWPVEWRWNICWNMVKFMSKKFWRRSTMVSPVGRRWKNVEKFSTSFRSCFDIVQQWRAQWDDVEKMLKRSQNYFKVVLTPFDHGVPSGMTLKQCGNVFNAIYKGFFDVVRPWWVHWNDVETLLKCSQRHIKVVLTSFDHGEPSGIALK